MYVILTEATVLISTQQSESSYLFLNIPLHIILQTCVNYREKPYLCHNNRFILNPNKRIQIWDTTRITKAPITAVVP